MSLLLQALRGEQLIVVACLIMNIQSMVCFTMSLFIKFDDWIECSTYDCIRILLGFCVYLDKHRLTVYLYLSKGFLVYVPCMHI